MTTITTTIAGRKAIAGARQLVRATAAPWRAWRDRPRTARVREIYCPACARWRHPRAFTATAATCRDCTKLLTADRTGPRLAAKPVLPTPLS